MAGLVGDVEEAYAYEVDGEDNLETVARQLLQEFAAITITTVKLSVGVVHLAWLLVSLKSIRDSVHWKMRYHTRNVKPGGTSSS